MLTLLYKASYYASKHIFYHDCTHGKTNPYCFINFDLQEEFKIVNLEEFTILNFILTLVVLEIQVNLHINFS